MDKQGHHGRRGASCTAAAPQLGPCQFGLSTWPRQEVAGHRREASGLVQAAELTRVELMQQLAEGLFVFVVLGGFHGVNQHITDVV